MSHVKYCVCREMVAGAAEGEREGERRAVDKQRAMSSFDMALQRIAERNASRRIHLVFNLQKD